MLPCKEVFKLKLDEHGAVVEHKARFTPKGFRQKQGVDFFETFARTGQYKTLRVALSLVAKWDHELAQFDVPTAFLNARCGRGHLHGAAGRVRAARHGVQAAEVAVRPEAGAAQLGPAGAHLHHEATWHSRRQ